MRKAEVPLKAAERLKDFKPADFPAGSTVVYRDGNDWKQGVLTAVPGLNAGGDKITLAIGGGTVEVNVVPKLVKYSALSGDFVLQGERYTVDSVVPGPNGEVRYELNPVSATGKVLHNIAENRLDAATHIKSAETKFSSIESKIQIEAARLLAKVRTLKSQRRVAIMGELAALDKKVKDLQHETIGSRAEDVEKAKELSKLVREAERELDDKVRELDKNIVEVEEMEGKNKEQREMAEAAETMFANRVKKEDVASDRQHKIDKAAWDAATAAYTLHEEWEKRFNAEKNAKQKSGLKGPALDAVMVTWETTDREPPKVPKPGKEPVLKKPSEDPLNVRAWIIEVYDKLSSPTAGFKDFVDEVDKARKKKLGKLPDFVRTDPAEKDNWELATEESFKEVMDAWKTKPAESFDFVQQQKALESQAAALKKKIDDLGDKALEESLDEILDGTPRSGSHGPVPICIKDLRATTPNVEDKIMDNLVRLNKLGAEVLEAELKKPAADRKKAINQKIKEAEEQEVKESVEGQVDLPHTLMRDILLKNPAKAKEVMEAAFGTLVGGKTADNLTEKVKEFFADLKPDDNIAGTTPPKTFRDELKKHGIPNWEAFLKRFDKDVAKGFGEVLQKMAEAELNSWLVHKLEDVKKDGKLTKEEKKKISVIGKMGGTVALRYLLQIGAVAVTGVVADLGLKKFAPVVGTTARRGIIGGMVGAVRGLVNFATGTSYEKKAAEAKAEVEHEKRELVAEALVERMFGETHGTGAIVFEDGKANELAHIFATTLRRETAEKKTLEVTYNGQKVTLKDDSIIIYHEALRNAALDEGFDFKNEEKTRYEFAAALVALQGNEVVKMAEEKTPYATQALKFVSNTLAGRINAAPAPAGAHGHGAGGAEGRQDKWKQVTANAAIGTTIGLAIGEMPGMAGAIRLAGGFTAGALLYESWSSKAEFEKSAKEAREMISKTAEAIEVLVANPHPPGSDELKRLEEYRIILAALLDESNFNLAANPSLDAKTVQYYKRHGFTVATVLRPDGGTIDAATSRREGGKSNATRMIAESALYEANKELYEVNKAKFADVLKNLQEAGNKIDGKAAAENKYSTAERFWKDAKHKLMTVAAGTAGAAVSWAIGEGLRAAAQAGGAEISKWAVEHGLLKPEAAPPAPAAVVEHPADEPNQSIDHSSEHPGDNVVVPHAPEVPGVIVPGHPVFDNLHAKQIDGDIVIDITKRNPLERVLSAVILDAKHQALFGNGDVTFKNIPDEKILNIAQNLIQNADHKIPAIDHLIKDGAGSFEIKNGQLVIHNYDTFNGKVMQPLLEHSDKVITAENIPEAANKRYWTQVAKLAGLDEHAQYEIKPIAGVPTAPHEVAGAVAHNAPHDGGTPNVHLDFSPKLNLHLTDGQLSYGAAPTIDLFKGIKLGETPPAWAGPTGAFASVVLSGDYHTSVPTSTNSFTDFFTKFHDHVGAVDGVADRVTAEEPTATSMAGHVEAARSATRGLRFDHPGAAPDIAGADLLTQVTSDHPVQFSGLHVAFEDAYHTKHDFVLPDGYTVAAGSDEQHLNITFPGASAPTEVRVIALPDDHTKFAFVKTELKAGNHDELLKDVKVDDEQVTKEWKVETHGKGRPVSLAETSLVASEVAVVKPATFEIVSLNKHDSQIVIYDHGHMVSTTLAFDDRFFKAESSMVGSEQHLKLTDVATGKLIQEGRIEMVKIGSSKFTEPAIIVVDSSGRHEYVLDGRVGIIAEGARHDYDEHAISDIENINRTQSEFQSVVDAAYHKPGQASLVEINGNKYFVQVFKTSPKDEIFVAYNLDGKIAGTFGDRTDLGGGAASIGNFDTTDHRHIRIEPYSGGGSVPKEITIPITASDAHVVVAGAEHFAVGKRGDTFIDLKLDGRPSTLLDGNVYQLEDKGGGLLHVSYNGLDLVGTVKSVPIGSSKWLETVLTVDVPGKGKVEYILDSNKLVLPEERAAYESNLILTYKGINLPPEIT